MIWSAKRNKVVLIYALMIAAGHVAIASTHGGPIAVPDIPAYLSVAQWTWGGLLPDNLQFHPGYGLLLSPFGALGGDNLHYAALLLNALLAGSAVFLAACLAEQLGAPKLIKCFAAIIATIQPGLAASSRIAWPETLLVVLILSITLLILRNNESSWRLASFIAALSICIHPRAVVLVIAIAFIAFIKGNKAAFFLGAIPGAALTALALSLTHTWPKARVSQSRGLDSYLDLAGSTLGQVLCFSAATVSLGFVGLALGLKDGRRIKRVEPEKIARCFVALSALGMIFLGGWALAGSDRSDTLLYSRYIDPWSVPLVIFALTALAKKEATKSVNFVGAVLTSCSLLIVLFLANDVAVPGRRIMTLPVGVLWQIAGDRLEVVACLAALLTFAGLWVSKFSLYLPVFILILLASVSVVLNNQHLAEVGQVSEGQSRAADLIPTSEKCLSHDSETTKSYSIWLYRLELPKIEHRSVKLSSDENVCGNYVIAGKEALLECTAAEFIKKEPRAKWGLWIYPNNGCR